MSAIIAIPTVEQINLEHQLANSKASEAVQHATNCGLMLLQVKASLSHGEWLPWLNNEIDSGRLKVKARQTRSYMQLASNWQRDANLVEAPSIRAALELLSDKEPEAEQSPLIPVDLEAERQARIAAEQKAEEEQRRSQEWCDQWKEKRDLAEKALGDLAAVADEKGQLQLHVAALERRINAFEKEPKLKPVEVEVPPADYEVIKDKAAAAEKELEKLKKEQAKLIKDQVAVKLQGYQDEVDKMERKKATMQDQVDRMKAYLESLDSDSKRIEVHRDVIEKSRLGLISLASFLNDLDPMNDKATVKKWLALADMHQAAADSIRMAFDQRTDLRIAA